MKKGPTIENHDPVYRHATRESAVILLAWFVFMVWVVGCSALLGYPREGEEIKLTWGMPSWVFWGVAVPWVVASLFSIWFSLFYMADDRLDQGLANAPGKEGASSGPQADHG